MYHLCAATAPLLALPNATNRYSENYTTAYHSIANGLVERFHQELMAAIKCLPSPLNWVLGLPWIQLEIQTAIKERE